MLYASSLLTTLPQQTKAIPVNPVDATRCNYRVNFDLLGTRMRLPIFSYEHYDPYEISMLPTRFLCQNASAQNKGQLP